MSQYFVLREATAVTLPIGPFIHLTAGTAVTTATIASTEVMLSKNGGEFVAKTESTSAGHITNSGGMYEVKLNIGDTTTPGTLVGNVVDGDAAAQPISFTCTIVSAETYDALYAASSTAFNASGQVNLLTATQAQVTATHTAVVTTIPGTITTLDTEIGTIHSNVVLALEDTSTTIPASLSTIAGYLTTEIADMYAELVTVRAEPAKAAPGTTISLGDKIDYLYAAWRNKVTQTSTQYVLCGNDGNGFFKATVADDGTTFTRSEMEEYP